MGGGRIHRRGDVLWRRSLDAVLVVPPGASEPVSVSGSSLDVWELLETPTSVGELGSRLSRRHGVASDVIERDLEPLIDKLVSLGIVVRA